MKGIITGTAMVDAVVKTADNSSLFKELHNALEIIRAKQNEVSVPLESLLSPKVPTVNSEETAQNDNPVGTPTPIKVGGGNTSNSIQPVQYEKVKKILDSVEYQTIQDIGNNPVEIIRNNINALNSYLLSESPLPKSEDDRMVKYSLYTILKKNILALEKHLINNPGDRIEVDDNISEEIQAFTTTIALYAKPIEEIKKELQANIPDEGIKSQQMNDILSHIELDIQNMESGSMDGRRSLSHLISVKPILEKLIADIETLLALQQEFKEEKFDNSTLRAKRNAFVKQLLAVNKLIENKKEGLRKVEEKQREALELKANPIPKKTPTKNNPTREGTESKNSALGLPRNYQKVSETSTQILVADDIIVGETSDSSIYGGVFQLDDSWAKGDRSNPLNQSMNDIYDYINNRVHSLFRAGIVKSGAKLYVGYSHELSQLSTDTKDGKYNNLALFVEANGEYIPVGPIQGKTNTLGKDSSKPTLDNGLFPGILQQAKEYARNNTNKDSVKDLIFTATPVGEFMGLNEIDRPISENKKYKIYSEDSSGDVVTDFDMDAADSVVAIVVGGEERHLISVKGDLKEEMISPILTESIETRDTAGLVFMLKPSPVNIGKYDSSYVDIETIKTVTETLTTPEDQESFQKFLAEQFNNSLQEAIKIIRENKEKDSKGKPKIRVVPLSTTSLGDILYLANSPHSAEISNSSSMPKYYMAVKLINDTLVLSVATRNSDTGGFDTPQSIEIDISNTASLDSILTNNSTNIETTEGILRQFSDNIINQMLGVDLRFNITGNTSKDLLKKLANFGALTTNRRTISPRNAVPIYSIRGKMDVSDESPSSVPSEAFDPDSLSHAVSVVTEPKVRQETVHTEILSKVNTWKNVKANKSIINQVKRALKETGLSDSEISQKIDDTLAIGFSKNSTIAKISEMMRDLAKCK